METAAKMELSRKEELTDALLLYMKNTLESAGRTIKNYMFYFSLSETEQYWGDKPDKIIPEGQHLQDFKQNVDITDDEFEVVINSCFAQEYIERRTIGGGYSHLSLTRNGFARANSVEKAKHYVKPNNSEFNITGTINATNVQIGNNNTQNIENVINNLIDEINKIDATPEQKAEAKNLLAKFLEHPIISGMISGSAIPLITKLLGG